MPHDRFIRNLKVAYLTAFCLIALLSTTKQVIIQYALAHELFLRSYANLLGDQALHSQRIQRNTLLLLASGVHTGEDSEIATDLATLEANHARFSSDDYRDYSAFVQGQLPKQSGPSPYTQLDTAARKLLTIEGKHLPDKARLKAEVPLITTIFYSEKAHLTLIEQSINIVNDNIDTFIHRIQIIELLFWTLTALTLSCEGLLVVRPALRELNKAASEEITQEEEKPT